MKSLLIGASVSAGVDVGVTVLQLAIGLTVGRALRKLPVRAYVTRDGG